MGPANDGMDHGDLVHVNMAIVEAGNVSLHVKTVRAYELAHVNVFPMANHVVAHGEMISSHVDMLEACLVELCIFPLNAVHCAVLEITFLEACFIEICRVMMLST